jgi:hypothetical protein
MSTDTSLRNIHHRRRGRIDTRKDFKLKWGCFILKHLHMMMANNRYHVQGGSVALITAAHNPAIGRHN